MFGRTSEKAELGGHWSFLQVGACGLTDQKGHGQPSFSSSGGSRRRNGSITAQARH